MHVPSYWLSISLVYPLLLCSLTIMLITDIMTATRKAAPNEAKLKFAAPMKKEVILSIAALMTNVNRLSVNKVSGSDKIVKIGLTNIFSIDKTKLAMKAVQILFTKII